MKCFGPSVPLLISLFTIGSAAAQSSCAAKALDKDGKPLSGATRTSFIKKCCEDSAVGADGKPLAGAARASYMKKCQADESFPTPAPAPH
jgi:hypothetical protein